MDGDFTAGPEVDPFQRQKRTRRDAVDTLYLAALLTILGQVMNLTNV